MCTPSSFEASVLSIPRFRTQRVASSGPLRGKTFLRLLGHLPPYSATSINAPKLVPPSKYYGKPQTSPYMSDVGTDPNYWKSPPPQSTTLRPHPLYWSSPPCTLPISPYPFSATSSMYYGCIAPYVGDWQDDLLTCASRKIHSEAEVPFPTGPPLSETENFGSRNVPAFFLHCMPSVLCILACTYEETYLQYMIFIHSSCTKKISLGSW